MDVLVLKPGANRVDWTLFESGRTRAAQAGRAGGTRGETAARAALSAIAAQVGPDAFDAIGVRMPFGGTEFHAAVVATEEVLRRLDAQASEAPLHLPPALALVRAARRMFHEIPVVLCFETAFFARLPLRERLYALDAAAAGVAGLRRYGYHGLYHEAACRHAAKALGARRGEGAAPKVLSVCLEPRPEIAAALGTRAVTVTGGATPLEGLPGRTTCGEIDPSIVLTLAEDLELGAEEIDALLTRESGLAGLVGEPATLEDVFGSDDPKYALARDVMRYRMLLAAGAAVAALGGLDAIVFSGRSAKLGRVIGPWLVARLKLRGIPSERRIACEIFTEPLERLIADATEAAARAESPATA